MVKKVKGAKKSAKSSLQKSEDAEVRQGAKLRRGDDNDAVEEETDRVSKENKAGKKKVKGMKIKSFAAARKEETEDDDQIVGQSRPKTASDQRRVLGRSPNEAHDQLYASALEKLEAGDEELDDDEMRAYIAEERLHLKKYGKVKLTPKNLQSSARPALMASAELDEEDDSVKVTMFETVDPAPQVGMINVVRDIGYERLEKGQTYLLPRNVAIILAEGRKGALHE